MSSSKKLRALLDTSVLTSALRSVSGASNAVLVLGFKQAYDIAASHPVFLEYEDVLQREIQRKAHGRSKEDVARFLTALARITHPVEIYFRWRPQLTDPNDDMVLDAAINGNVDVIVTHNLKHFRSTAARFGIRVLTPEQFLKELRT